MMNWGRLEEYTTNGQLFDEFMTSVPKESVVPIGNDLDPKDWITCMRTGPWRVELRDGTARLVNMAARVGLYNQEIELYIKMKRFLRVRTENDVRIKNRIALVLAGGGAKGSYQIGAWEALQELGAVPYVGGIAGTSIGAVNALLFARGELGYAKNLWTDLSESCVRAENRQRLKNIYKKEPHALGEAVVKDKFLTQNELRNALFQAVSGGYGDRIRKNYRVYSTAVKKETWERGDPEATYMCWDQLSNEEIARAALASSAVPLVYNPVRLKNNLYYDGGIKDNVPVEPLCRDGYRRFIVIHLQRDGSGVRKVRDQLEKYGCRAVHIVPNPDFEDGMLEMLRLTPEDTRERMKAGYRDTIRLHADLLELTSR